MSVKGALGAEGQSFLVLPFPLSEGPKNDYFIWLLSYLVSKTPTDQPVVFIWWDRGRTALSMHEAKEQQPSLS